MTTTEIVEVAPHPPATTVPQETEHPGLNLNQFRYWIELVANQWEVDAVDSEVEEVDQLWTEREEVESEVASPTVVTIDSTTRSEADEAEEEAAVGVVDVTRRQKMTWTPKWTRTERTETERRKHFNFSQGWRGEFKNFYELLFFLVLGVGEGCPPPLQKDAFYWICAINVAPAGFTAWLEFFLFDLLIADFLYVCKASSFDIHNHFPLNINKMHLTLF